MITLQLTLLQAAATRYNEAYVAFLDKDVLTVEQL